MPGLGSLCDGKGVQQGCRDSEKSDHCRGGDSNAGTGEETGSGDKTGTTAEDQQKMKSEGHKVMIAEETSPKFQD